MAEFIFQMNGRPMETEEQKIKREIFEENLKGYFKTLMTPVNAAYHKELVLLWDIIKNTPSKTVIMLKYGEIRMFKEFLKQLEEKHSTTKRGI